MRKTFTIFWMILIFVVVLLGCGKDYLNPDALMVFTTDGWAAFSQGNYQEAFNIFSEAKALFPENAEVYTALGWSLMKLDNLDQASAEFNAGSTESNPSTDLFAGWAFVLNALKNYFDSNTKADQALTIDPNWSFAYGLPLSAADLHILKAENYFLLGDFSQSLAEVQILNPSFNVDITASEGQALLAEEIEWLKGNV